MACGLVRGSFVPSEKFQELRALQRTRKQLTREQTRHVQRLQKTLEEANIKLDSVISDITGLSGRRMIEAIIAGVRTPRKLADLADRRISATPKELYDALNGRVTDHHRFRLRLHLGQYDALAEAIAALDREIDAAIGRIDEERESAGQAPFRAASRDVCEIPGINVLAANNDPRGNRSRYGAFPDRGTHWSGLCPGDNESAGKRKSSKLQRARHRSRRRPSPMRGVRQQQEGQRFQSPVPAPKEPSRRAESFRRKSREGNSPYGAARGDSARRFLDPSA